MIDNTKSDKDQKLSEHFDNLSKVMAKAAGKYCRQNSDVDVDMLNVLGHLCYHVVSTQVEGAHDRKSIFEHHAGVIMTLANSIDVDKSDAVLNVLFHAEAEGTA